MIGVAQKFKQAFSLYGSKENSDSKIDHYLGLDFLRGVAALGVVLFHFSGRLYLFYMVPHGYLAVDFFFVLSGFVLARAYERRLVTAEMRVTQFYMIRIIRLMPLIILGTFIAAVIELGRPSSGHQVLHLTDTLIALGLGSILIPILFHTTLEQIVFPLNGPVWSLFFEAISNIIFAPCAKLRISHWGLYPIMAMSAAALCYGAYWHNEMNFGSGPGDFLYGFPRTAWSFSLGMLLYRWRHLAPRVPFLIPVASLVILMELPSFGHWNGVFDGACIFVALPCVVFTASRVNFGSLGKTAASWSGDLSYPVYAIHYPIVRAIAFVCLKYHLHAFSEIPIIVASVVLVIAISVVSYVFYDLPIRKRLLHSVRSYTRTH